MKPFPILWEDLCSNIALCIFLPYLCKYIILYHLRCCRLQVVRRIFMMFVDVRPFSC